MNNDSNIIINLTPIHSHLRDEVDRRLSLTHLNEWSHGKRNDGKRRKSAWKQNARGVYNYLENISHRYT